MRALRLFILILILTVDKIYCQNPSALPKDRQRRRVLVLEFVETEVTGLNYAISDIHGRYDKYKMLLKEIRFSDSDTLYILGDVIDRGGGGIRILQDAAERPNIKMLMGNHEEMAIDALPAISKEIAPDFYKKLFSLERAEHNALTENGIYSENKHIRLFHKKLQHLLDSSAIETWFDNGGEATAAEFFKLSLPDAEKVWSFLKNLPLYMEVRVGDKDFVLVHSGFENFYPNRPLSEYDDYELLWCRPDKDTVFFEDKYTIFGHTPTQALTNNFADKDPPKIFRNGKIFDIDCGCGSWGPLGCLCLEDFSEIYI